MVRNHAFTSTDFRAVIVTKSLVSFSQNLRRLRAAFCIGAHMNRHQIEQAIPYEEGEPFQHQLDFDDDLRVLYPGKYNKIMHGGDFVVELKVHGNWHRASGTKLLNVLGEMVEQDGEWCRNKLGVALALIEEGKIDYDSISRIPGGPFVGMTPRLLLRTTMLMVVHERRKTGKKSILVQLMMGVIYNDWSWEDAALAYKSGERGLRKMRAINGREPAYKELI